jgi:hypothetical protein
MEAAMKQNTTIRFGEYTPTSGARLGRELTNHINRSGTTIHGWSAILFGSMFAIIGTAAGGLAAAGKLNASPGMPPWLGPVISALFALAGLSFVLHGFAGLRVQRRVRRLRATHVREPWVWDHPWNESGSTDESGRGIARAIWLSGFLALFAVPVVWIGFFSLERPAVFAIVGGAMVCGAAGCLGWVGYLLVRRAKYGVSMLRFRRYPFRVGGEVELHLARPASLAGIDAPVAELRCVQERYEVRRSRKNRQYVVVAYEIWSVTKAAEFERGEYVWRFEIPEELPGTALSERPPRYWELELKVETAGVDYAGTFLVPLYEDGRRR